MTWRYCLVLPLNRARTINIEKEPLRDRQLPPEPPEANGSLYDLGGLLAVIVRLGGNV